MPYFRELPNINYSTVFQGTANNDDTTNAKNLFKRPQFRQDLDNSVTTFTYYQIRDDERPEQVAEKFYQNPELDWIVLLTNNIIDIRSQWPLDNNSLYNFLLDKYGSDEELYKVHHYETVEFKDKFGRVLIEAGLEVDQAKSEVINTNSTTNSYPLSEFPSAKSNTIISVNLNQRVTIYGRDIQESTYDVTDISAGISNLKVRSKDRPTEFTDITIVNSLANWPSGWGGLLRVGTRDGEDIEITVADVILDNKVRLSERLYEVTGTLDETTGILKPTFNFTNEIPA